MSALRAMFSLRKTRSGFSRSIDLFGSGYLQVVEPPSLRMNDQRYPR